MLAEHRPEARQAGARAEPDPRTSREITESLRTQIRDRPDVYISYYSREGDKRFAQVGTAAGPPAAIASGAAVACGRRV